MAEQNSDEKGSPFKISNTGWSFLAIGLAFLIIGMSTTAFLAIGIVFMILGFAIKDEEGSDSDEQDLPKSEPEDESDSKPEPS